MRISSKYREVWKIQGSILSFITDTDTTPRVWKNRVRKKTGDKFFTLCPRLPRDARLKLTCFRLLQLHCNAFARFRCYCFHYDIKTPSQRYWNLSTLGFDTRHSFLFLLQRPMLAVPLAMKERERRSCCIYTSTIFFQQPLYVKQVGYKDFMSVKQ